LYSPDRESFLRCRLHYSRLSETEIRLNLASVNLDTVLPDLRSQRGGVWLAMLTLLTYLAGVNEKAVLAFQ